MKGEAVVQQLAGDKDPHTRNRERLKSENVSGASEASSLYYQHARADPNPFWASVFSSVQWERYAKCSSKAGIPCTRGKM